MIIRRAKKGLLEPLGTAKRILPILWEAAPRWTVAAGVLMLFEIAFGLLTLYLVKHLVDVITSLLGVDGATDPNIRIVLWQVLAFAAASIAFAISRGFAGLAREAQGMQVADHVDRMIHSRALTADLAFYESPRYFDTLQRARQSGNQRPAMVTQNMLLLAKNLAMLVAVTLLLISINWMLLPILAFAIVPALLVRLHFTRVRYEWQRRRTPLERRAGYLDWLMVSDIHAKELRLNQLGDFLRDSYTRIRAKIRDENLGISRQRTMSETAVGVISSVVFFAALAYLAIETASGGNTVGDLVLFLLVFQRAQSMGQEIVTQFSRFYEDHLYIGLLFEFLDLSPEISGPESPSRLQGQTTPLLEVKGLSFRYPGTQPQVLKEVNLEIRPGQIVALVGANGSGKTSLIKLLTRLYDPTSGVIRIDGRDIRDFDLNEYRRLFSVIFQDFSRYSYTVGENIRFGDISLPPDSPEIETAARKAGAEKLIAQLPSGYDTLLSRMFENGQEISVGQWQKIALARAFIGHSGIIILDEPTSALDPNAEFELFQKFRESIGKRSALVISHRLSTVRMADYIYVLDQGKVVEHGTHASLHAKKSYYRQAFTRQAMQYR